jgi:hypothetical protein
MDIDIGVNYNTWFGIGIMGLNLHDVIRHLNAFLVGTVIPPPSDEETLMETKKWNKETANKNKKDEKKTLL